MKPTFTSQSRGSKLRNWRRRLRLDYLWHPMTTSKKGDGGRRETIGENVWKCMKMYENVKHDAAEIAIERERYIYMIYGRYSRIAQSTDWEDTKTAKPAPCSKPSSTHCRAIGFTWDCRWSSIAALNSRIWIYWIYCCILMCQLLQLRGWREICWSFARRAPPKSDSGGGKLIEADILKVTAPLTAEHLSVMHSNAICACTINSIIRSLHAS